jgi:hypothetical protein
MRPTPLKQKQNGGTPTMPKAKDKKKGKAIPAMNSRSVMPSKIVPHEIRRLMNSHRNSPHMSQAVITFINESGRPLDTESLPLLSKSGFTSCQIPKMASMQTI